MALSLFDFVSMSNMTGKRSFLMMIKCRTCKLNYSCHLTVDLIDHMSNDTMSVDEACFVFIKVNL